MTWPRKSMILENKFYFSSLSVVTTSQSIVSTCLTLSISSFDVYVNTTVLYRYNSENCHLIVESITSIVVQRVSSAFRNVKSLRPKRCISCLHLNVIFRNQTLQAQFSV